MAEDNRSEDEIHEEEDKAMDALTVAIRDRLDKFFSPFLSILDYCWECTLALFVFQQVYRHFTGVLPYSVYGVTIFLWFPLAMTMAVAFVLVSIFYVTILFNAWIKFLAKAIVYFRRGWAYATGREKDASGNGENGGNGGNR